MQISTYKSPLGILYFLFNEGELVYISFDAEDQVKWRTKNFPKAVLETTTLKTDQIQSLENYFLGQPLNWPWPFRLVGTTFQKQVWEEILKIPHGQFSTYKNIGLNLNKRAYQAIGQAVGANPLSILVPCHRVLGTNWLGGYGGGINRKRLLLELENVTLAPNLYA